MIGYLLTCLLITLVTYFYWWKRRRLIMLAERLPGPPALPIIGNALLFRTTDLSETFKIYINFIIKYGNVVRFWLGPQLVVAIQDPDHIEKIILQEKNGYRGHFIESILQPAFENGLLVSSGERWRRRRKTLSSGFQNNILNKFVDRFSLYSGQLAERVSKLADGKHHEIYTYFLHCTLDIICDTGFGYKLNAQVTNDLKIVESLVRILELLVIRFKNPWLMIDVFNKLSGVKDKYQPNIDHLHNIIREEIKVRKKHIQEMRASGKEVSIDKIKNPFIADTLILNMAMCEEDDITGEITTLAGAGSETTANTCCYVLALLSEHYDIQDKVLKEQREIFWTDFLRPVTANDLQQMTYLEQVVKETLRIFPGVPILYRDITQDIELDGHIIPAGCVAMLTNYLLHRNPKYYSNPDKFDPEHFSTENCISRHPYAYFPFGLGRRMCLGYQYAMMEMKTVLSTLIRRFHFSSVKGGVSGLEKNVEFGVVLKAKGGFNLSFTPRDCVCK